MKKYSLISNFLIDDFLTQKDYDFTTQVITTIKNKTSAIPPEKSKEFNFDFLKYYEILLNYLKTRDPDILDRQPFEIRETLKDMIAKFDKKN